jgi:hypothetical protein
MSKLVTVLVALLTFVSISAQTPQPAQPGRRVAITVDDGPVVNEMSDLGRFRWRTSCSPTARPPCR